ncbi:MAG: hypothetical protein HY791_15940 [Deltaproteobacteria bacterium]|nr:hypothetical protein [Deltaproteobacteria bacterium]
MLDDLKRLLAEQGVTRAAIIDDAYDDAPVGSDIDPAGWNVFLDDAPGDVLESIGSRLAAGLNLTTPNVFREPSVLQLLWELRNAVPQIEGLFSDFLRRKEVDRRGLAPLEQLLKNELELELEVCGSVAGKAETLEGVQVVFLDMYLGSAGEEEARDRAVARVRKIASRSGTLPPLVILISSSVRLDSLRDDCRERAQLLGCQFRALEKGQIADRDAVCELLIRLVSRYQDTLSLSSFLEAWRETLNLAADSFLGRIRRLDLRDYADIQQLVLDAEGALVGSHMLETYDEFFHFMLEGDSRLRQAGRKLDAIKWGDSVQTPPHFLPSEVANDIVDGLMFHHPRWIDAESEPDFGDVYLCSEPEFWPPERGVEINYQLGERLAVVLLTQACDIQQGYAKRLLFVAGVARPAQLVFHQLPAKTQTPIMKDGEARYVIVWNIGAPVTWTAEELVGHVRSGKLRRARRFRMLYALQLQQHFATTLTRVGTPAMLPPRYYVGIQLSFKHRDGRVRELLSTIAGQREAVAQVGRQEKTHLDHLTLSAAVTARLEAALAAVDVQDVSDRQQAKWRAGIGRREMYWAFETGIMFEKDGTYRPFQKTEWDVVQVIGPAADREKYITSEQRIVNKDAGPIFLEVVTPTYSDRGPQPSGPSRETTPTQEAGPGTVASSDTDMAPTSAPGLAGTTIGA